MGKLFGTDGVRGVANSELTPEMAFQLGKAGAQVLKKDTENPAIIIGRDTRISGGMLEAALTAGICSVGVDVISVGVIPTPGIAYLTRTHQVMGGVMVSASHNPVADNGIKFFAENGFKLSDSVEDQIEELLQVEVDKDNVPIGGEVGEVRAYPEGVQEYVNFLKNTVEADLSGVKIVLDCANGAAYQVAPQVFEELGAEVIKTHCEPNGLNINHNCGSTHLESLQDNVVKYGADLGLAFDGDADRVLAVDEKGEVVDGDQILAICASNLKEQDLLAENLLVVTVMSNLGLYQACERLDISVSQTKVGDRYVLEEMLKSGSILGGEQSGHIIYLEHNTTGDGVLTGLLLLSVMTGKKENLAQLKGVMEKLPQVLVNVTVKNKRNLDKVAEINNVIEEAKAQLDGRGRILVRASGTEPLVRVMAEGPDMAELEEVTNKIAAVIKQKV
ncbi:phosphoglucosamine mutase [Desulfitispora alkaliphila]|uniref:phosphoglucosamine mutase n=1 Tax=Desulfitispora alkaliphila TaxID=622674 RepID=UPI003D1ECFEA